MKSHSQEIMLALDRLRWHNATARMRRWWRDDVLNAPLEPILHPSRLRLMGIGLFTGMGHLVFLIIWSQWLPQPYENVWVRALVAISALVYFSIGWRRDFSSVDGGRWFTAVTWLQLPWFFSWMYLMNDGNGVWLASLGAMILIYFHFTDWRLASIGLLLGSAAGTMTAWLVRNDGIHWPLTEHLLIIAFASSMGLLLGMSSANLRRVRLVNTLSTMGVMAHELRTPLATVHLMGDVLRNLAQQDRPDMRPRKIEELGGRLQNLVRSMNRHIDMQIANAQMMRLPREQISICASDLVRSVADSFPYRTSRERACVNVHIERDFRFRGAYPLFAQVLANLIKNSLHALASASTAICPGDLRITVDVQQRRGRISVADEGVGIPGDLQSRIFEPFYSTQAGAGNGLGLSFCRNVVEGAHGRLTVHSQSGKGAVFTIDLPLERTQAPNPQPPPHSSDPCH